MYLFKIISILLKTNLHDKFILIKLNFRKRMKKIFGSKSSSEGKEEKGGAGVSASPPVPQGYSAPPIAGANTGYGAPPPYSFSPQDACGGGASSAPPPPEFQVFLLIKYYQNETRMTTSISSNFGIFL